MRQETLYVRTPLSTDGWSALDWTGYGNNTFLKAGSFCLVAGGRWLDILWSLWKYLYTMIRLFNAVGHVSDLCLCQWTYQELDQSRTQGIGCTLCQKEGSGCDVVRGHMERMH